MPAMKLSIAFHPLRDDLALVCVKLDLGPVAVPGFLYTLLANNSLVSKCKIFPVATSDEGPPSVCLGNVFSTTHFYLLRRCISYYLGNNQ